MYPQTETSPTPVNPLRCTEPARTSDNQSFHALLSIQKTWFSLLWGTRSFPIFHIGGAHKLASSPRRPTVSPHGTSVTFKISRFSREMIRFSSREI